MTFKIGITLKAYIYRSRLHPFTPNCGGGGAKLPNISSSSTLDHPNYMFQISFDNSKSFKSYDGGGWGEGLGMRHPVLYSVYRLSGIDQPDSH